MVERMWLVRSQLGLLVRFLTVHFQNLSILEIALNGTLGDGSDIDISRLFKRFFVTANWKYRMFSKLQKCSN